MRRFANLRAEMARHGITNVQIAKLLGVDPACVSNRLTGRTRFFYDEALRIKKNFFPEHSVEYLFDDPLLEEDPEGQGLSRNDSRS